MKVKLLPKNNYQKLIEVILCYKKNNFNPIKDKEQYSIDSFCWRIDLLKEADKKIQFGNKNVEVFYKNSYQIIKIKANLLVKDIRLLESKENRCL